jgi:hypothetical protein
LSWPLQALVRAEPFDVARYAGRWEARAAALPTPLAGLARDHAAWARRELPALGLLSRRAYLVIPADDPSAAHPAGVDPIRARFARWLGRGPARRPIADAEQARATLAERCARLESALGAAGVRAARLGDLALSRLYRACWGPSQAGASRDRDLAALFGSRS